MATATLPATSATPCRFRLLAGAYHDRSPKVDADGKQVKDNMGELQWEHHFHHANDPATCIITTNIDLVALGGREKFENLDGPRTSNSTFNLTVEAEVERRLATRLQELGMDPGPVKNAAPASKDVETKPTETYFNRNDLNSKSVKELRKIAETEEIDLDTAVTKEEIINTLMSVTV